MVKLNYELTEELMTKCNTLDDLKAMHTRGVNFMECSRLAIDDALARFFKKKCNFNKEKAVEMLVALINGQEVQEEPESDAYRVHYEDNSPANLMDPVLRMQKIAERVDQLVPNMKDYYEYNKKLIRDPELKMLGATEEDLKEVAKKSSVAICGQGWKSKKLYLMKREQQYIDIALKEGDSLFYAAGEKSE